MGRKMLVQMGCIKVNYLAQTSIQNWSNFILGKNLQDPLVVMGLPIILPTPSRISNDSLNRNE